MSKERRSLSSTVKLSGVGLHTGAKTRVEIGPAEAGDGIVFSRTDLPEATSVTASVDNVLETDRRTSIGGNGTLIETVEHVLAANQDRTFGRGAPNAPQTPELLS